MAGKDKIVKGLSDALHFAKGADNGERITFHSATEFFLGGVRFNPGRYSIKKLPDVEPVSEIGARATF